jgi:hypothetical protein
MFSLTGSKPVAKIPITPETLKTSFELTDIPVIYKDFVSFFVSGVVGIQWLDRKNRMQDIVHMLLSAMRPVQY